MAINAIEIERFINARAANNHNPQLAEVTSILEELFLLLEDYSPAWYTEEQRLRTLNALLRARRLSS